MPALLSENGTLEQVLDIQTEQPREEDGFRAADPLPSRACETNGGSGRQLCDNAGYLLGIDGQAPANAGVL
ncbi:MAG: hypothetical protein ACLRNW_09680 [Neglectibacter sp.]